ncbi:S41 family peptidase [Pseudoalteromonas luteoviolacea]|uniref:S41 family peptidase n=1 Tax=Pseudoalteromonas luteoviolacea TaxID=43657 RepID=UPI001F42B1A0|nr:S41 family peptidase [Pseudoalteromonas luteoviolacea]MCF6442167.1 S41 family peptidase [Pseudoalteromonas luteoviolacea]
MIARFLLCLSLCVLGVNTLQARAEVISPAQQLQPTQAKKIVEEFAQSIEQNYVFTDIAKKIAAQLRGLTFQGVQSRHGLSKQITDLVSQYDKHLALVTRVDNNGKHSNGAREPWFTELKRKNSGVRQVEVLAGNIGYLEMWGFDTVSQQANEAIAASMTLLQRTDALILDFSQNGGGDGFMVSHLASYFLKKPTLLHTYLFRNGSRYPFRSGQPMGASQFRDMPLYILIGPDTFSAGEAFAYAMKHLGRATLIGEPSKGGANPINQFKLSHDFIAFVAIGTSVSPITGENWEGKGVIPEIKAEVEIAKSKAHLLALQDLADKSSNPYLMKERVEKIRQLATQLDVFNHENSSNNKSR